MARGRLKLREEPGAAAHLIAYERPDLPGPKESRYRIVPIGDPAGLKEALAAALGTRVVVSKERRLFVFAGVRIHLDRVDGLGDFIEFEGVAAGEADPRRFEPSLAELRRSFGIEEEDLLGTSYSDLLEAQAAPSSRRRRRRAAQAGLVGEEDSEPVADPPDAEHERPAPL